MTGSLGLGLVGSSVLVTGWLMKACTAVWNCVFAGSVQTVGVTLTAATAPSSASGVPAEGRPIPGWVTSIGRWPTVFGNTSGVSACTSDLEIPGIAGMELEFIIVGQADRALCFLWSRRVWR